jgi:hypothetical protein
VALAGPGGKPYAEASHVGWCRRNIHESFKSGIAREEPTPLRPAPAEPTAKQLVKEAETPGD